MVGAGDRMQEAGEATCLRDAMGLGRLIQQQRRQEGAAGQQGQGSGGDRVVHRGNPVRAGNGLVEHGERSD